MRLLDELEVPAVTDFSKQFPELLLASYTKNPSAPHDPDGLIQVWNMHLHDRPEYVFHAQVYPLSIPLYFLDFDSSYRVTSSPPVSRLSTLT